MDTLLISRCIFLFFIVVLSAYFVYLNKYFSTRQEHFTEEKPKLLLEDKVVEIVKAAYSMEYKRKPTANELAFFQAYNIEKQPTEVELAKIVKSSGDIISKSFSEQQSPVFQEALGTEDEVEEIFNNILNRRPTPQELSTFSKMLKNDSKFTLDKMKQVLYGSEEYFRLEKTQTNQVNAELMGGVTDRQITYIVMSAYKTIVGKDTIDPDELHFLKKKFVEFNLDEKIFKLFLTNYFKNQPFNQQVAAAQVVKNFAVQQEQVQQESSSLDKMKKELYTELMNDLKKQNLVSDESKGYTDQKGVEHQEAPPNSVQNPNKQVIEVLLKTQQDRSDNYLDSSDVLDNIKKQSKCVFSKDMYQANPDKSLAALIEARNKQNLKDTCVRNKMFLGLDEDMVLDPSFRWTIPNKHPSVCVGGKNDYQPMIDQTSLIGTLLQDSQKTKVGDVVSPIPPK